MAIIRYRKSNAPAGGQRYVQRDDGKSVDLLTISDTGYTVDSALYPQLVALLDANPLVQRSGGEGSVVAPNAPDSGINLGWAESSTPFTAGTVAPANGANANVADVPGMALAVINTPARPFYLWASALTQLGKGTGATGGLAQIELAVFDNSDMNNPLAAQTWSTIVQASPLQNPLPILPFMINPGPGLSKTYKLACWATLPAGNGASIQVPTPAFKIRMGIALA